MMNRRFENADVNQIILPHNAHIFRHTHITSIKYASLELSMQNRMFLNVTQQVKLNSTNNIYPAFIVIKPYEL